MEPHEAISLLSRPHVVLQGRDSERVFRLAESLKEFLGERAADFVRQHRQDPLLEVFMSDGDTHVCGEAFFFYSDRRRENTSIGQNEPRILDAACFRYVFGSCLHADHQGPSVDAGQDSMDTPSLSG